MKLKFF